MKRTVAIVAGGFSSEHDVSLRSAAGILSFMNKELYDCYVVDVERDSWTAICGDERCAVDKNDFSFTASDGKHVFDFAFITIHGTPGEDGPIQGYFDLLGIPYSTSNLLVEALTFNKYVLNTYFRSYPDIHISDSILLRRGEPQPVPADVVARLGLPCFVKPNAGGSSFGITKVKTAEELPGAIDKAMGESDEVMIERFIAGTEVTNGAYMKPDGEIYCFPLTEVALKGVEFFDYDAKYEGKSDEITPARISDATRDRIWEQTRRIYLLLGCYGLIRIDYILSGEKGNEQINLLEINTTPGMTAASFIPQQVRAAGLDIADVLAEIIEGKFK